MYLTSILLPFILAFTTTTSNVNKLPSIELKKLSGESVNLQSYGDNGKVTVISYWATWCSPCKRELDAIADVYPDWQEDYNMELLAITIDDARALAKVRPMVQSKGWEYEILSDTRQASQQALNFQTIPQTFVVDTEGNIVYSHNGYKPGDEYDLEDKLAELAGK